MDFRATAKHNYILRNLVGGARRLADDRLMLVFSLYLLCVLFLAAVGPMITPYEFDERVYSPGGDLQRAESPSLSHPLGTTNTGYDIFSRVVYGARPTVITGLLGGSMILGIGLTIGVTAGYVGGTTDKVLMRFTDLAYGVPLIPFALVLLAFIGIGFLTSVIVIGLILWRGNARVLRSQVLQIKNRPYIKAIRATGASRFRIIVKHIIPNIAPMAILFFALGVGYSILLQASLAFIGLTNPFVPSWGIMVRNAYNTGIAADLWWWTFPPGILIALTVLSTFMIGRKFEVTEETESIAEMG